MLNLRAAANVHEGLSLSNRMRARRFAMFEQMASRIPRLLRIIDIGGTNEFWAQRCWAGRDDVQIVTVNIQAESRRFSNIECRTGDATSLVDVRDRKFDVAFSNSVIEHLYAKSAQRRMADEVRRIASVY